MGLQRLTVHPARLWAGLLLIMGWGLLLAACGSDSSTPNSTAVPSVAAPTPTRVAVSTLPPTWTPIPTATPLPTATPRPPATSTPIPTATPETSTGSMLLASNLIPSTDTYGVFTGDYGTITGSFQSTEQWDITACDLTITYTLDLSKNTRPGGAVVGVTDGAQGWMNASAADAIQTDDALLDRDDRMLLESPDYGGEATYNVLDNHKVVESPVGDPALNYGIWFDRDGVAPNEASAWGAVDGGTYNTGGVYTVSIIYHSFDSFSGTMFATVNGLQTGFYELAPNGPPDHYPVGKIFEGEHVYATRVFATVNASQTTITDLTVTGCLTHFYVEIDLLPGDDSNCISSSGSDPIAVAIMGSITFNVDEIDPNTLVLAGLNPVVVNGQPQAYATNVNSDRYPDLLVQFDRAGEVWPADQDYAVLEGQLRDFTPFEGTEDLCVTP